MIYSIIIVNAVQEVELGIPDDFGSTPERSPHLPAQVALLGKLEAKIRWHIQKLSVLGGFSRLRQWSVNSRNGAEDHPFQFDGVMHARRRHFAQLEVNSDAILLHISFWIAVLLGTFFSCLARRKARSRSHAGQALFMSVLLSALPVTAGSVGSSNTHSSLIPHHESSFPETFHLEFNKLIPASPPFPIPSITPFQSINLFPLVKTNTPQLFTPPAAPYPRSFLPTTLLLAALLTTTFIALLFSLLRSQYFTKYFLCIGLLVSALSGAVFAKDVPDFVFRYLFFGVNGGLVVAGLEIIVSRLQNWRSKQVGKGAGFVGDAEGGKGDEFAAVGVVVEEKNGLLGH
jgi:hypothetical protein